MGAPAPARTDSLRSSTAATSGRPADQLGSAPGSLNSSLPARRVIRQGCTSRPVARSMVATRPFSAADLTTPDRHTHHQGGHRRPRRLGAARRLGPRSVWRPSSPRGRKPLRGCPFTSPTIRASPGARRATADGCAAALGALAARASARALSRANPRGMSHSCGRSPSVGCPTDGHLGAGGGVIPFVTVGLTSYCSSAGSPSAVGVSAAARGRSGGRCLAGSVVRLPEASLVKGMTPAPPGNSPVT